MSKKRSNKLFENIQKDDIKNIEESNITQVKPSTINDNVEKFFNSQHISNISDDDKQKLETFDKIVAENKRVYDENLILIEKAAEYSEQREELLNTVNNLKNELNDVKLKNDELTHENDNYLIKISELTFEIANLQSQIEQLNEKHSQNLTSSTNITKSSKIKTTKNKLSYPNINTHVKYNNQNGYDSWN